VLLLFVDDDVVPEYDGRWTVSCVSATRRHKNSRENELSLHENFGLCVQRVFKCT
jgi:hypothetical protein